MITTIQIDDKLKEKLDKLKLHHRETYNELMARIIENFSPKEMNRGSLIETIEVLSDPETMRDIAEALEAFNSGKKGKTLEQVEKEIKCME